MSTPKQKILLVLSALFWMFHCPNLYSDSLPDSIAQKQITLSSKKAKIANILAQISEQSSVVFSYKSASISKIPKLNFRQQTMTLGIFLESVLKAHYIKYTFIPPNVIVLAQLEKQEQEKYSISGFVSDSITGEKLIGCNLIFQGEDIGIATNHEGFYSIQTLKDSLILQVSYIGYRTKNIRLEPSSDIRLDISLTPSINLPIVIVSSSGENNSITKDNGNNIHLKGDRIGELSPLFGESDVFRTLQLLPGIQSVGEGTPGLFVRGGSPDQNLVLLDGIQLYNPIHIFGFYSIFNPGIVKDVSLKKGAFSAKYGGRLSSVIDVITKDGNNQKIQGEGMLGIMGSRIVLEGPIDKSHKTTFVVSARRSHIDLLLSPFIKANLSTQNAGFLSAYYFYDLNGKITSKLNQNSKLTLSFYNGGDNVSLSNSFKLDNSQHQIKEKDKQSFSWGNTVASIRWSQIVSSKTILKTTLWYSAYNFGNQSRYSFEETTKDSSRENFFDYRFESLIRDMGINSDLEYFITKKWKLNSGIQYIFHYFQPGVTTLTSNLPNLEPEKKTTEINIGAESSIYFDNHITLWEKFDIRAGLNIATFIVNKKGYPTLQPRCEIVYNLTKRIAISSGFSRMQQYLHLLSNSTVGIPQDLWILATENIAPQNNNQFSLSFKYKGKFINFGIDAFSKKMSNVIEYKEGENYLMNSDNWENKISVGIGDAKGIELYIEKSIGRFTGWIGYCLSRSTRQFSDINNGEPFVYRYNRLHDLSSSFTFKIDKQNSISVNFIYATGTPITLPEQIYSGISSSAPLVDVYVPGQKNNYIMPDYNRLDINYSNFKSNRLGLRVWAFGFYNIYNRQNPFFIAPGFNDQGNRVLRQVTLFPIIPSITYRQSF